MNCPAATRSQGARRRGRYSTTPTRMARTAETRDCGICTESVHLEAPLTSVAGDRGRPLLQSGDVPTETSESPLLEQLNPIQREAVLHTEGPVLIVAGAGAGKTRALTHRVAYLIRERNVAPGAIIAITFTNKAAQEMADRVEGLLGTRISRAMWILTFHSSCARILRREHNHLGLPSTFSI